jgi:DME family drug/metabolite transporter
MGVIALIAAAVLWGMIGPFSKIMFAEGVSPLETAFWRGNIAGLAYIIHGLLTRAPLPGKTTGRVHVVLFGIFGVALLEGSYVMAVKTGGAALASVLLYSAPIWVNVTGFLFFKDRPPTRRWAALLLSFIGVAGLCLAGSEQTVKTSAIFWGLASGLSYAGFYIAGRQLFHKSSALGVFMIAFPVGSLAMLPFIVTTADIPALVAVTSIFHYTKTAQVICILMGLISTYAAYLLYGYGLQRVGAGKSSIITMIEPVVSVALAVAFFGESFSVAGYGFAALVLIGVALA